MRKAIGRGTNALLALGLGAAALLAGCETRAPYEPCELDSEVTSKGICTGSGGSTSCVVKQHPHCEHSVCLSYFSQPPVCTKGCTTDAECGSGATCWSFAEEDKTGAPASERYCVPSKQLEAAAPGK